MSTTLYTIGRGNDNDIVIHHVHVSRRHAYLESVGGGAYKLIDAGSSNGTFVNSRERRIEEHLLQPDDVVYLSRHYDIPARRLIQRLDARVADAGALGADVATNEAKLRIGSASDNDIVLKSLRIAAHHAEVLRLADGTREIRDLSRTPGTYVDGKSLKLSGMRITGQERIVIGGTVVSVEFERGSPVTRVAAESAGLYLNCTSLTREVRGKEGRSLRIIDGVDLTVYPGEVVGLLGPSGCGKTSLLDLLSGAQNPTGGAVRYDGEDLHANLQKLLPQTGYVPQDDILHPELTVREELFFNARLRLPAHTESRAVHAQIEELCERLGLHERIDTIIGSPGHKTLSGGQRKRVSLAIELLTDPRILFLDEPTSGLSSRDARLVVELIRELASERGVGVIITIHQPSLRVYRLLDNVVYLKAGKLVYFGPSFPDSVSFFESSVAPEVAGPDAIMERLDEQAPEALSQRYRASPHASRFVVDRAARIASKDAPASGREHDRPSRLRHFAYLTRRYLKGLARSRTDLAVAGVQAAALGFLTGLVFYEQHPINRGLFIIVLVSIWLGTNNSAREIVGEQSILRRERRAGLRISSYFGSKFVGQMCIAFVQSAIFVFIASLFLDLTVGLPALIGLCALAALVGVVIGLAISAVAKTQVAAVIAIPLVLVPFIVLGGLLVPWQDLAEHLRVLAQLTPSRWSYEALVAMEFLSDPPPPPNPDATTVVRVAAFSDDYWTSSADDHRQRIRFALGVLTAQMLVVAAFAIGYLKVRGRR